MVSFDVTNRLKHNVYPFAWRAESILTCIGMIRRGLRLAIVWRLGWSVHCVVADVHIEERLKPKLRELRELRSERETMINHHKSIRFSTCKQFSHELVVSSEKFVALWGCCIASLVFDTIVKNCSETICNVKHYNNIN